MLINVKRHNYKVFTKKLITDKNLTNRCKTLKTKGSYKKR